MMSLNNYFSKYELTQGQKKLVLALDEFLNDNTNCFLLKGYAGTGKTFMMHGFTNYLKSINRSYVIAAPTGRAAKVVSQKTKNQAYTIHKTIYYQDNFVDIESETNKNVPESYLMKYELNINDDNHNTIYIIDEASMLSNIYSAGEFFRFGSGYLLKDLIEYVNPCSKAVARKIIFIGDNAQLPPVGMSFSPALSAEYLQENFKISVSQFELTDVVRQKQDSGILKNSVMLRNSLLNSTYNLLQLDTTGSDTIPIQYSEVMNFYLDSCKAKIDDSTIIIAFSNSSAKEYNDMVRSHFFPGAATIKAGDRVMVVENNYNIKEMELLNGDFGTVVHVSDVVETHNVSLSGNSKSSTHDKKIVTLNFRDISAIFTDSTGIDHVINCTIIENLLYSNVSKLTNDEVKALYIDFVYRHQNLKRKTKEFKDTLRADKYFNALRLKFGYAVTCHKAQGGEWDNVILNCNTSQGYFNPGYYRWLYTGITRASNKLMTLGTPDFSITSHLLPPAVKGFSVSSDVLLLNEEDLDENIPFCFPDDKPFLKNIWCAVNEILKDEGVTVTAVRHSLYLEHYNFKQGNEEGVIKIHYSGADKVTTIEKSASQNGFLQSVHEKLKVLQNKKIIIQRSEENSAEIVPEVEFEFDHQFLKDFYDAINEKLKREGLTITSIDHKQYHEIYEISKNNLKATYKFHYNGRNQFGKFEIITSKTTGLTDEIGEILNG